MTTKVAVRESGGGRGAPTPDWEGVSGLPGVGVVCGVRSDDNETWEDVTMSRVCG